jgi:hypothetical protein
MTYIRAISFIGVAIGALFLPLWSFVILAVLYAFVFSGYELIVLSVLIDAQFGDTGAGVWYAYTLSASLVLLVSVYLKPYLRFYA